MKTSELHVASVMQHRCSFPACTAATDQTRRTGSTVARPRDKLSAQSTGGTPDGRFLTSVLLHVHILWGTVEFGVWRSDVIVAVLLGFLREITRVQHVVDYGAVFRIVQ